MFCPKCKSEYVEGITECTECKIPLVPELEQAPQQEIIEDLITIAGFSQPMDANIAKSKLESEGIDCFLLNEHTIQMNWLYSQAVGGVKLQVKESDVEKAKNILGQKANNAIKEIVAAEDDKEIHCPRCNSTEVFYEILARKVIIASWILLGIPLPFLKRKWRCRKCGCVWKGKLQS